MAAATAASVQWFALNTDFGADDLRYLYLPLLADEAPEMAHGVYAHASRVAAALIHGAFGLHAFPYYVCVLLTHAANVALVSLVVRTLGISPLGASAVATFWGSAPGLGDTLQRVSAFPSLIATTALLWSLLELAAAAQARKSLTNGALVRINLMLLGGAATGPVGSAVAATFPALAYLALPSEAAHRRNARLLLPSALLAISFVISVWTKKGSPLAGMNFYEPSAAIVVVGALGFIEIIAEPVRVSKRWRAVVLALLAAWSAAGVASARWGDTREAERRQWTHDEGVLAIESISCLMLRTQPDETIYVRNDIFMPISPDGPSPVARAAFPGIGAYWILARGTRSFFDRKVRFVEQDREVLKAIQERLAPDSARMFVPFDGVSANSMHSIQAITESLRAPSNYGRHAMTLELLGLVYAELRRVLHPGTQIDPQQAWGEAVARDQAATKAVHEAILQDPAARGAVREAISKDPAALEAVKRALQGEQEP
jgi:hypothetical protein